MKFKSKKLNFTKMDLIKELARKSYISKVMSRTVVDSVLGSITKALKKGHRVEIRGLGVFELREYKAYQGRNPHTGAPIQVKSKKIPFFKPGTLKNKVNKSTAGRSVKN